MNTIPLSNLVPAWRGAYTPEAYAAVEKGLLNQRVRFMHDRYVVISLVHKLNYDGLESYLYFDAGLRHAVDAIYIGKMALKKRLLEVLISVGPKTIDWIKIGEKNNTINQIHPKIELIGWERLGDGSGYNAISVYAGVVEITEGNPLNNEDLAAIGQSDEVVYFMGHYGSNLF